MDQRTCNIIEICKGNCKKYKKERMVEHRIARYMGEECNTPCETYSCNDIEKILITALYDYF